MNICAISDHLIRNIPYVTYHNKYIYIKESFKKTCSKNVGKKRQTKFKKSKHRQRNLSDILGISICHKL